MFVCLCCLCVYLYIKAKNTIQRTIHSNCTKKSTFIGFNSHLFTATVRFDYLDMLVMFVKNQNDPIHSNISLLKV